MTISATPVIERIARVLAGQKVSANGAGDESSAGPMVDQIWPDFRDHALAVLRTLREPDEAMARAGDADLWDRMVLAALSEEA